MDGFILLDKPVGYTSRKACDEIGKLFHTKKVGHSGTLDPFATGLLIVSINKATKSIAFLDDFSKKYIATLKLGEETDSLDNTGKVVKKMEVKEYKKEEIEKALNSFLGHTTQVPPMTSAIHINGKKLYTLAHQGIEVDRPSRDIYIDEIKLLGYQNNIITFEARVSKGTYIRVLGQDIAYKLGTCGHLISLRRTEIGPFKIEDATTIEEVKNESVISVSDILSKFSSVLVYDEKTIKDVKDGKILNIDHNSENDKLLILDTCNNAIAMYTKNENGQFVFKRGLF